MEESIRNVDVNIRIGNNGEESEDDVNTSSQNGGSVRDTASEEVSSPTDWTKEGHED
jgi:hypothetical protein